MLMRFDDSRYTDLIKKFDNWYDMKNITRTFKHMGLECDVTPEEYVISINNLKIASALFPEVPLHEAYAQHIQSDFDSSVASRGLGDTIFKITHATGLDKLAELYTKVTGKDCGCKSRQEALNKLVPYGVKEV